MFAPAVVGGSGAVVGDILRMEGPPSLNLTACRVVFTECSVVVGFVPCSDGLLTVVRKVATISQSVKQIHPRDIAGITLANTKINENSVKKCSRK